MTQEEKLLKEVQLRKQNTIEFIQSFDWRELQDEKYEDTEYENLIKDEDKNSQFKQQSSTKVSNNR